MGCIKPIFRDTAWKEHRRIYFLPYGWSCHMNQAHKPSFSFELLYIIGIIAISFSSIFVRWSEAEVSVIAMYRLYLTNLIMLPLVWKYRTELFSLTRKQWMLILWSGIALGLHFLLWMGSLRLTTVASSTVIMTLEPILVMLGSFCFSGRARIVLCSSEWVWLLSAHWPSELETSMSRDKPCSGTHCPSWVW